MHTFSFFMHIFTFKDYFLTYFSMFSIYYYLLFFILAHTIVTLLIDFHERYVHWYVSSYLHYIFIILVHSYFLCYPKFLSCLVFYFLFFLLLFFLTLKYYPNLYDKKGLVLILPIRPRAESSKKGGILEDIF